MPDIRIEEVGRLQFRGRFKAGMDEDHSNFVTDNDSRETQETWEAYHSEGVRESMVTKEMPPAIQELHDQSLTQARDVLRKQKRERIRNGWRRMKRTEAALLDKIPNSTLTVAARRRPNKLAGLVRPGIERAIPARI